MSARSSVPHAKALAKEPAHVRPRVASSDMKQHDPFGVSDQAWHKCKELDHGNRMMSGKKRALAGAIREGVRKKLASIRVCVVEKIMLPLCILQGCFVFVLRMLL
jgi:hypothetical protein